MIQLDVQRLGVLMQPDPAHPEEVEGVLNPAAARGPDGQLYLFPRYVGKGNYSRIGIARVKFDDNGNPVGVERLGIALEPETDYETWPDGRGGCEDPRVSYVEPLGHYVMTYTAWSDAGPRIAIARSLDLLSWTRIGLAKFNHYHEIALDGVDNKDACVFPEFINNPDNHPSVAMLHRPLFPEPDPKKWPTTTSPRLNSRSCRRSGFRIGTGPQMQSTMNRRAPTLRLTALWRYPNLTGKS